jgi:hypothetical protein
MFAVAAISPGSPIRAISEIPHPLSPRIDSVATVAILVMGLVLVAGAVRTVLKR